MTYIEAVNRKYERLYELAVRAITEKMLASKVELQKEIGATTSERDSLFKRYPELSVLWKQRTKPKRKRPDKEEYPLRTVARSEHDLTQDIQEARSVGLTYGQWRAQRRGNHAK